MSEVFKEIKESLTMQQVATHFGYAVNRSGFILSPFRKEKTASCKLYLHSFYDFSSGTGGDCIRFVSLVLDIDNWQAAKYLCEVFSLPISLSGGTDRREEIERRQRERQRQEERKQEFRAALSGEIDSLKRWADIYRAAIEKRLYEPFSDMWGYCINELQKAEYKLDILCAADQGAYRRMKPDTAAGLFSDCPKWLLDTLAILAEDGAFQPTKEEIASIEKQGFIGAVSGDGVLYSFDFADFGECVANKLPLFNLNLLPCKASIFSKALCESLQVNTGMIAPAIMAVSALGIQKKYNVRPTEDWEEPANLYMAVIAEPSERKSPAMNALMQPVYEYEAEENERLAPEIATYKAKKEVLENRIRNTINSLSKSGKKKGDEKYLDMGDLDTFQNELNQLEEVASVRLAVDDVTMEVLGKLLEQNKERIGIMSTEGGIFNILAGRYSDKTVIDIVLKAYSGDRFSQDRLGRKGQTLNSPLITMLLYVQPIIIKEVMENSEFVGRGLNARFLYSIPPSTIGKRRYRVMKIPDTERMEYISVMKRLFAIPVPDKPKIIELDEEADRLAENFFYEIEKELEDASPEFKAWLGKLHGTTMRIALSLHCLEYIEESGEHKISGETMGNAIQIGRYFKAHAEAAYNIMGLIIRC